MFEILLIPVGILIAVISMMKGQGFGIFRWCVSIFGILALALPVLVLLFTIVAQFHSGIPLGLAVINAPLIFIFGLVVGLVLQGAYSFSVAKSIFAPLKDILIYYNGKGEFIALHCIKEKLGKKKIKKLHKYTFNLSKKTYTFSTLLLDDKKKEWENVYEKPLDTTKLSGIKASIVRFIESCNIDFSTKAVPLNHGVAYQYIDVIEIREFDIPKELKQLKSRDRLRSLGRFSIIASIIICIPFLYNFYFNSSLNPCSIYYATQKRDTLRVKELLDSGANPNVSCKQYTGMDAFLERNVGRKYIYNKTPLIEAINNGSYEIVELLLGFGAKVVFDEKNALNIALENKEEKLVPLILENSKEGVNKYINHQFIAAYNGVDKLDTPLIAAIRSKVSLQTIKLLLFYGASVNAGEPLYYALRYSRNRDNPEIIKLLIENGANTQDERYLPLAFEYASLETIELLFNKGAFNGSAEQKKEIVESALRREYSSKETAEYEQILKLALKYNDDKKLIDDYFIEAWNLAKMKALLDSGANINSRDNNGNTLLMKFIIYGEQHYNKIIYLLEHGADVNIKNNEGKTALDLFEDFGGSYDNAEIEEIEKMLKA